MSDFEPFSLVNGQEATQLSVFDRGLAYGDGFFETMRLENGRIPLRELHLDRLLLSSQRLAIPLDPDTLSGELDAALAVAAGRGLSSAVVKLVVTRGSGGRGYTPGLGLRPNRVISISPLPAVPRHCYEDGVKVYVCNHRLPDHPALAGIKHLNKLDHVLASMEWSREEFQEGLLLGMDGRLIEACSRNLFVRRGGVLFTPHLQKAGVAGVLRRRIMEGHAAEIRLHVQEADIDLDFLAAADELFLSNSITGVWPVRELIGGHVGRLRFSKVHTGRRLQELFEKDLGVSSGLDT